MLKAVLPLAALRQDVAAVGLLLLPLPTVTLRGES